MACRHHVTFPDGISEIEQSGQGKLPIFHGVAAVIYAQNGMIDRGKEELDIFNQMAPDFVSHLWAELDARNIQPAAQAMMAEDLRKLGATIPPRPDAEDETARAL